VTAAIGAEAAGAAGVGGETVAAGASRVPASAPTGSAPVGSAGPGAGRPSAAPRTQRQLGAKGRKATGRKTKGKTRGGGTRGAVLPGRKTLSKGRLHIKGSGQRLLLGEFILCTVIVALSPLTDRHKDEPVTALMKRATGVAALFLVLALVSTGGKAASRVAAAFGGLATITLLVSDRDLFTVIAHRFGAANPQGPAGPTDGSAVNSQLAPIPDAGSDIPGFSTPGPHASWWDRFLGGLGPI